MANAADTHSVWQIEGPSNDVFLVASVHFLRPEHYPLPAPLEAAYSNSAVAVFEADLADLNSMGTQMGMVARGMLPSGQTLKTVLEPKTYRRLSKVLAESGLEVATFERFKPWMVSVTLAALKLTELGFSPEYGLDLHFHTKALRDGKPVIGLETVAFQLGLFDSLAADDQDAFLSRTLDELDAIEVDVERLVTAWQTGDMSAIEDILLKSFEEYPDLHRRLLIDRNLNWVDQIEGFLRDGRTHVVIVGAAHMAGKGNVVKQLRERGYTVQQQ